MNTSTLPLAGRRVIEVGTMLAAPFAAHLLGQLGAEVIKVEPPHGDPTRALVRGGPSGTFIAYSHGKKSVCLDLAQPEGHAAFCRLLHSADALVHNLAPRAARKLRLTEADCRAVKPSLIYCHIRGYAAGPLQDDLASNPVAEAATGVMEQNRIDGRPSRLGPSYHDQFAGAYAVIGVLAGLLQQAAGKPASAVEVGLYETGLHVASRDLVGVQLKTRLLGRPEREPHGEFSMPGYGAYQSSDQRWLYLLMLTDSHWHRFCRAMQLAEADDPELASLRNRRKQRDRCEALVRQALGRLAFDEAAARLQAAGIGCTEVLPLERVLEAPQARQPGKLRDIRYRGLDFEVPEFPRPPGAEAAPTLPPPELGEHTRQVLQAVGLQDADLDALARCAATLPDGASRFAWAPVRRSD